MNDHIDRCNKCRIITNDLDVGFCLSLHKTGCGCGGTFERLHAVTRDGRLMGYAPDGDDWPIADAVTPEEVTQVRGN